MGAAYSTRGVAYQKRGENDLAIADLDLAVGSIQRTPSYCETDYRNGFRTCCFVWVSPGGLQ
jgi:hypothetical protein